MKKPVKRAKKHTKPKAKGSIRAAKCPMPPREPPLPTSIVIPSMHYYEDPRGRIENYLARPLGSFAVISSKKGTVRAEHWHKKDWHFCWVAKGKILYFERPVGSDELPKVTTVTKGQMFFTGPNLEHSMYFTEDTTFTCMGKLPREQKSYENDLVRLEKRLTDIPLVRSTYGISPAAPEPAIAPIPVQVIAQPEVDERPALDMPGSIE